MTKLLGIITGSDLGLSGILEGTREEKRETPFGRPSSGIRVGLVEGKEIAYLCRHGEEHEIPPHKLNYRANIHAFSDLGVTRIVGTSSVGSLREEIGPSDFVIPSDFVSFWNIPTYHDQEIVHVTPVLDPGLRSGLVDCVRDLGYSVHDSGVYVQTTGPRLETRAEIDILKGFGDVVGMTMPSEATLAVEKSIAYACMCSVDNYCHGVVDEELSYDDIVEHQRINAERILNVIKRAIEVMG